MAPYPRQALFASYECRVVLRFLISAGGGRTRLDFCGNLPQVPLMSQSIRLNGALIEAAKRQATLFYRSPPQQIEHWAAIGQVMEQALSYPALEKVVRAVGRKGLEQALAVVGTPEEVARRMRSSAGHENKSPQAK